MLAAAERGSRHTSLLFIDLDRFKPVNDTYGLEAGDQVLRSPGSRPVDGQRYTVREG